MARSLYEADYNGTTWRAILECPTGQVPPPTITCHLPLVGELVYTYAGAI